jgi:hypothetical protein
VIKHPKTEGNEYVLSKSIWCSKFEELKIAEENFIMYDNENPDDLYQILKALATAFTGFGCKDNVTIMSMHVHCFHHSKGAHPFRDHSLKGEY